MPMRGTFSLLRRGVSEDSAAAKSSFLFFLKFFGATKNSTQVPRLQKYELLALKMLKTACIDNRRSAGDSGEVHKHCENFLPQQRAIGDQHS
jgi:hypothetical protein